MRDLWICFFFPFQLEKAACKHFVYGKNLLEETGKGIDFTSGGAATN